MCLALRASGLWLRYATLQKFDPFLSLDCAPRPLHPGAIQGKEGIKFCHLATLAQVTQRNGAPTQMSALLGQMGRQARPAATARVQVRHPEPAGDPAAGQGGGGGQAAPEQAAAHHGMDGDQMTDVILTCYQV